MAFEGTLQEITVRMHGNETRDTRIEVQQGDTASRKVRIRLKTFGGSDYIVPYGARAALCISKNDGKKVYDECDIEDKNVLLVTLSDQAISCSGLQKAQIYIFSEEGDIKTQVFQVNVPKAVYSDDTIESSDEFGILHELIAENSAIQQAEQIRMEAETERVSNEEERQANAETMATATEACLAVIEDARAVAYARGNAIVQTASGETIVIDDSSDDQLRGLRVFGKTEQFTTTGKNLLENTAVSNTVEGITFTVNDDGSITINGTATANASLLIHKFSNDEEMILSGCLGGSANTYRLQYYDYNPSTFAFDCFDGDKTIPAGKSGNVRIYIASGTTVNTTIKPMIRLASITDDTYEPYTGGIPSPNPQYPQELVSVGDAGDVEVGVYGANLLDIAKFNIVANGGTITEDGITFTLVNNEYITVVGTSTKYPKIWQYVDLPNGTYVLSGCDYSQKTLLRVRIMKNGTRYDYGSDTPFEITDDVSSIQILIQADTGWTVDTVIKPMLNRGSIPLPYEPYRRQSLTIPTPNGLPGIKVPDASLATYTDENGQMWCADEVDFGRGVYVQRVEVIESYNGEMVEEPYMSTTGELTTGAKVFHILATPIETPLTESELAAYQSLHSNYPVTTVLNDAGAHMEFSYNADTKTYIDNKFAELQTALVALGGN